MSHAHAARGARQTAVLTAIVGLHFAAFLVIAAGLAPSPIPEVDKPGPITWLPPPVIPKPVIHLPPDKVEFGFADADVPKPDVTLPTFDETQGPAAMTSDAGAGATIETKPVVDSVAPSLRTRPAHLTALIDSCYPAAARRLGEEGKVIALVTIGAQGSALGSRVAQSSGFPRLDAASACVVRKLEFVAGRKDGRAVEAEAQLPIVFRLN